MNDSSVTEILEGAGDVLTRPTESTIGLWPRAAAVLARQALEQQLKAVLTERVPGIDRASVRVQLLCLLSLLEDTATAHEVSLTWWALSRACHHHSYELPPTAAELSALIDNVDRFVRSD